MRRSWIALVVVLVIIVIAVIIGTRPPKAEPPEEPVTPSTVTPSTVTPTTKVAIEHPKPATDTVVEQPKPGTTTPVEPPKKPEPPKAEVVLKDAEAQVAAGKRVDAMKTLSAALLGEVAPDDPAAIKERQAKLATEALFGPKPCPPLSVTYTVESGDTLTAIAKKHKTTYQLIMRVNGLKSDVIRVGQRLKVIAGGFDVEISKGQFLLTVIKDGLWVREFKVGLGRDGSTPVGAFIAGHKLKQPTYFGDGAPVPYGDKKNNPLGTRWITIQGAGVGQYGIHGTWEPESMGKEMSKGCVRMLNADVEWLFDLIVPDQSKIVIKP
ncbi:L,D-transpeptidase family protein [Planctomycetota bacterium]